MRKLFKAATRSILTACHSKGGITKLMSLECEVLIVNLVEEDI